MPSDEETRRELEKLETEAERAEREAAGLNKPKRGRPPGTANKPKLSDEALTLGCKQLISVLWLLAKLPAALTNHALSPLTDAEKTEGAEQAKALVQRFGWLAILLSVVGFPLWFLTKIFEHAERMLPKKKETPVLSIAPAVKARAIESEPETDFSAEKPH